MWIIWLELLVSFIMGLECYLHLLKFIRPSKKTIRFYLPHLINIKVLHSTLPYVCCHSLLRAWKPRKKSSLTEFIFSVLVVYSGAATPPNYYQSHKDHHSRPPAFENDHDCNGHFRHTDQHQRFLYLDTSPSAD